MARSLVPCQISGFLEVQTEHGTVLQAAGTAQVRPSWPAKRVQNSEGRSNRGLCLRFEPLLPEVVCWICHKLVK
jgi:hypothetical protein